MKKIIFNLLFTLVFPLVIFSQGEDPVLFSIDGSPVHVSEFNYIYTKNNGDQADYSKKSIDEYLDLYIKFKLKVAKAKSLQIDTIPALINELAGYRRQLSDAYLVDREVTNRLVKELFERKKRDINVSHLLISVNPTASQEERDEALHKAQSIKQKIDQGADFDLITKTLSDDKGSAPNGGKLGWMTALLPDGFYEFENAIYALDKGEVSGPVKSRLGYHIIKVNDIREAYGEMEVKHILIRSKMKGQTVKDAKTRIDSLYQVLKNGGNFDEIAKAYSEDINTSAKGGYIGFFGISQYEKAFEDAAFKIQTDGEISMPVESKLGWHIIQRVSKKDYSDLDKVKRQLETNIAKNERYEIAKNSMLAQIQKDGKYYENQDVLNNLINQIDKGFYSYKWEIPTMEEKTLFGFGEEMKFSNINFAEYCQSNTRNRLQIPQTTPVKQAVGDFFVSYVKEKTLEYEEANLEKKHPDFKALMREYSEGILLFEATKMKVWDKAALDTAGLKQFYDRNQNLYYWNDRAELTKYSIPHTDKKNIKELTKGLKKKKDADRDKYFAKKKLNVSIEKSIHEINSKELKGMEFKKWAISEPLVDEKAGITIIRRIEGLMPGGKKTMKEARGFIIADYQDELEKQWIKELKNEYSVEVNQEVLNGLIKN